MNEFKNKSLYIIKSQSSFKGLNWGKKKKQPRIVSALLYK